MVRGGRGDCRDLLAGPEGKPAEPHPSVSSDHQGPPCAGRLGPVEAYGLSRLEEGARLGASSGAVTASRPSARASSPEPAAAFDRGAPGALAPGADLLTAAIRTRLRRACPARLGQSATTVSRRVAATNERPR